MPLLVGSFFELLQVGVASNWWGLACPAHCSSNLTLLLAVSVASFCVGMVTTLFFFRFVHFFVLRLVLW